MHPGQKPGPPRLLLSAYSDSHGLDIRAVQQCAIELRELERLVAEP
jgi:hypothetical protein